MKTIKLFLLATLSLSAGTLFAQTDAATTQKIVEAKKFTFIATTAIPMNTQEVNQVMSETSGGGQRGPIELTRGMYTLKINGDSTIAYLPYYGRAYQASMNSDGGVKFSSGKADFNSSRNKKGVWSIKISPKDITEGYQLQLTITKDGSSSLWLNSNNKQGIRFEGYLKEQ